jgi:hypothetical protein
MFQTAPTYALTENWLTPWQTSPEKRVKTGGNVLKRPRLLNIIETHKPKDPYFREARSAVLCYVWWVERE